MPNKKNKLTRARFQVQEIEIGNEHLDQDTHKIELALEFNGIDNTSKAINLRTGKVIENKAICFGYFGENKIRKTAIIETYPNDHSFSFKKKLDRYKHIVAIDTNGFSFESDILKEKITMGLGMAVVLILGESN